MTPVVAIEVGTTFIVSRDKCLKSPATSFQEEPAKEPTVEIAEVAPVPKEEDVPEVTVPEVRARVW